MIKMSLTGRTASDAPSKVAGKLLGVKPRNERDRKPISTVVHWGYGTAWGGVRGLPSAAGVGEPAAGALHFFSVWGAATVMLPSLDQAPPPSEWGAEMLATDALHHAVFAAATGPALAFIDRH